MPFTLDDENEQTRAPANSDVAALADDIINNAPKVSEHVVNQSGNESASTGAEPTADTDSAGDKFDSAKHSAGSDGKGIKTAKGLWRKKRVAGNSRVGTSASAAKAQTAETTKSQSELDARARMAGRVAAMSQFMVCSAIFGPEWKPIIQTMKVPDGLGGEVNVTINEAEEQSGLWGEYFVATGRTDFPPGVALTIGILSYAGRRATMPETQRRAQSVKEWLAHKWLSWKLKRKETKAERDARANTGKDSQRKDDTGKNVSADVSPKR